MTESKKAGQAAIGIIGGSGLYDIEGLERVREVRVRTPFGAPSDAIRVGVLGGIRGGTGSVPAASTIAPISMR